MEDGPFSPRIKKKKFWSSLRPRPKLLGHGPTLDGTTLRPRWSQDHPKLEKILLYIKFYNFIIFLPLKKICDHPK